MVKWSEDCQIDENIKEVTELPLNRKNDIKLNNDMINIPFKEKSQNNIEVLQRNLGKCLQIIDEEVMKGYVTKLEQLPIVKYDKNEVSIPDVQLFKITELVYQEEEFSVHKLSTLFHSLTNRPCTLIMMIKSNGNKSDFYLGVRSLNPMFSTGRMRDMLQSTLKGLFPGSHIEPYIDDDMNKDMNSILENKYGDSNSVSCVTCVADYKQEQMSNKNFIQGLEKFVESMHGKSYTAFLLADSVLYDSLSAIKNEYENIYTQISPFANMQLNFTTNSNQSASAGISQGTTVNHNYGQSMGDGTSSTVTHTDSEGESYGSTNTRGTSDSSADGKTDTTGYSDGVNSSVTDAHSEGEFDTSTNTIGGGMSFAPFGIGVNVNASVSKGHGSSSSDTHSVSHGTSHSDSASSSISRTLSHGINESHSDTNNFSNSSSDSQTNSTNKQSTISYNIGETFNFVDTQTLTDSFGASQGVTLNAKNMMLISTLKRLETQMERLDECESIGMWKFASYFIAESPAETETAANTYKSIMSGAQTGLERSAVNTWDDEKAYNIKQYVTDFCHPIFEYRGFSYEQLRTIFVNPTSLVSTNELAIHMGLPRHSVKGLPVVEHAIFAQEVISRKADSNDFINIGKVYHLGEETETDVKLDVKSLAMHTFITGSTGAGKSNTVYSILSELEKKNIPFLVVEPAKGEYKNVFKHVNCFGTNPKMGKMLQINPFSFPDEIHVLEHIDRLVGIFNVCWPMYAAMPAVLKDSIEKAYKSAGWNLDLSVNEKVRNLFPTFDDVLRELNNTINSTAYSSDTKGDYIGSLSTRIKSLTNGINGRIFSSKEMNLCELFDESAILDISRVGSMETKSLIMGLVILKLQEYCMSNSSKLNADLNHVTVLEEAHNILRKTSTEQSMELANLQGKSVEMLSNAIAEIRTYGEGVIIVDQAPDLLDVAAIRNTNTKIVLRLPEINDREITGKSMALDNMQIVELSKLSTGVAAVYQNDWQEAVLCKIPEYIIENADRKMEKNYFNIVQFKRSCDDLLHDLLANPKQNDEDVVEKILNSNVSAKIKLDLIQNYKNRNLLYEWAVADYIKKNYEYSNVFNGTQDGTLSDLSELTTIMEQNIKSEFEEFSHEELRQILYYMCRIYHELFPKNAIIEKVRTEYLKVKLI